VKLTLLITARRTRRAQAKSPKLRQVTSAKCARYWHAPAVLCSVLPSPRQWRTL